MSHPSAIQDFFGQGGSIEMEARDEAGLPADVSQRNSLSVLARVGKWLRHNGPPAALAALMSFNAVAGTVSNMGASQAELPSTSDPITISQLVDAHIAVSAKQKQLLGKPVEQARQELDAMISSTLSSRASQGVSHFSVIDTKMFRDSNSPYMMALSKDGKSTVCVMNLNGFDTAFSSLLGKSLQDLPAQKHETLQQVVIQHEAAHCEEKALLNTHFNSSQDSFAGYMSELSSKFSIKLSDTKNLGTDDDIQELASERYADTKVVLLAAKDSLASLDATSSSTHVKYALEKFDATVEVLKDMRRSERNLVKDTAFNDHDTLHVVEHLQSFVHKTAQSPGEWAKWSAKHLQSQDDMADLSGRIAMGSVMQEREEIAQSKLDTFKSDQEASIKVNESVIRQDEKTIKRGESAMKRMEAEFLDLASKQGQDSPDWKLAALGYRAAFQAKEEALGENATQEQLDALMEEMQSSDPLGDLADAMYSRNEQIEDARQSISHRTEALKFLRENLVMAKDTSMASRVEFEDLSDGARLFAMQANTTWSEIQKLAGPVNVVSHLQELAAQKATEIGLSKTSNLQSQAHNPASRLSNMLLGAQGSPRTSSLNIVP